MGKYIIYGLHYKQLKGHKYVFRAWEQFNYIIYKPEHNIYKYMTTPKEQVKLYLTLLEIKSKNLLWFSKQYT